MSFYSCWHQKQLVVIKCVRNTIHNHHNSFHMRKDLREIWFISASTACIFFFPSEFHRLYVSGGIMGSITMTLRHCVHSSLKKALVWSVWEMMKRRSEDCFYSYVIISPIILEWERCRTALKSWNTFIVTHSWHIQETWTSLETRCRVCWNLLDCCRMLIRSRSTSKAQSML